MYIYWIHCTNKFLNMLQFSKKKEETMLTFKEFLMNEENKEDEISYTNYYSKQPHIFHVTHKSPGMPGHRRLGDDKGYDEKGAHEEALKRFKAVPGRTFKPKW